MQAADAPPQTPENRALLAKQGMRGWVPPLIFLLLAAAFLWRSLFAGEVFLPAALLAHAAPWKGTALFPDPPIWNPLRWDGIGQFYPWRHFAAETLRSGVLPLWNPYQFCGTPFAANSQSAVYYPGNLLFALIPDTARAFAWSALLHLTLCGWFTYLLLRRLRLSEPASLLGGVVFAYSAWQVAWLQLPTFLCTSCWFPLLLRGVLGVASIGKPHRVSVAGVALTVGAMLLAGHLQIALYGLIAAALLAGALLLSRRRSAKQGLMLAASLTLGFLIAMPQILPAVELSRISHRVGKPSMEGFRAYTEYGLPTSHLSSLLLPGLFGGDTDPAMPYWGYYVKRLAGGQIIGVSHNPAETAIYVGIAPLLLALFACIRRLASARPHKVALFFAGLCALALLLALGTPVNSLLYFGVPGFAQSGSPARCLVLWCLGASALAAIGLDAIFERPPTRREVGAVFGLAVLLLGIGLNLVSRELSAPPQALRSLPLVGEALGRVGADWVRLLLVGAAVALLMLARPWRERTSGPIYLACRYGMAALAAIDLLSAGIDSNPTAHPEQVYPETAGVTALRDRVGHSRIFPVNQRWSLFAPAGVHLPVSLPPNAATVFHLRDVQGYDSLFSGRYKEFANRFARPNRIGQMDASPPEVGNIVFFQNANAREAGDTAALLALSVPADTPGFSPDGLPQVTPEPTGDPGLTTFLLPGAEPRAELRQNTPGAAGVVEWLEDDPTRVALRTESPAAATLLLRDSNLPGWRATVDGRSVGIDGSADNPVIRMVSVPAGSHTVLFRYEPATTRIGIFACLLSLTTLLAFACAEMVAEPRSQIRRG